MESGLRAPCPDGTPTRGEASGVGWEPGPGLPAYRHGFLTFR